MYITKKNLIYSIPMKVQKRLSKDPGSFGPLAFSEITVTKVRSKKGYPALFVRIVSIKWHFYPVEKIATKVH